MLSLAVHQLSFTSDHLKYLFEFLYVFELLYHTGTFTVAFFDLYSIVGVYQRSWSRNEALLSLFYISWASAWSSYGARCDH